MFPPNVAIKSSPTLYQSNNSLIILLHSFFYLYNIYFFKILNI